MANTRYFQGDIAFIGGPAIPPAQLVLVSDSSAIIQVSLIGYNMVPVIVDNLGQAIGESFELTVTTDAKSLAQLCYDNGFEVITPAAGQVVGIPYQAIGAAILVTTGTVYYNYAGSTSGANADYGLIDPDMVPTASSPRRLTAGYLLEVGVYAR